nr:hypothetical protein [Halomonas daqiaonensis]
MLRLVPQHQPHRFEALPQVDAPDMAQLGMVAQDFGQPVAGDATAEVVDMVNPDIGGEPAQGAGRS